MHPQGHEFVVCVAGRLIVLQDLEGETVHHSLAAGDAVINPPSVWHTADVDEPATVLFVTAGLGTQHRPR